VDSLSLGELALCDQSCLVLSLEPIVKAIGFAHLDGALDGVSGRFLIDTGDRSSLTIFGPFALAHDLAGRYPLTPEVVTGWGIGGPIPARVARVDTLRIRGASAPGVVKRFPTGEKDGSWSRSTIGARAPWSGLPCGDLRGTGSWTWN